MQWHYNVQLHGLLKSLFQCNCLKHGILQVSKIDRREDPIDLRLWQTWTVWNHKFEYRAWKKKTLAKRLTNPLVKIGHFSVCVCTCVRASERLWLRHIVSGSCIDTKRQTMRLNDVLSCTRVKNCQIRSVEQFLIRMHSTVAHRQRWCVERCKWRWCTSLHLLKSDRRCLQFDLQHVGTVL